MIYKNTSIKTVIANIQNSFTFEGTDWISKAVEFIPMGMSIIGTSVPLEKTSLTKTVENYRVSLPCNLENLLYVTYLDRWLPLKSNSIEADKLRCNDLEVSKEYFAVLNPNYLQTSFESGDVIFYYESLPLDDNGFPLVPDSPFYVEALGWFVTYKLLTSGYVHKTIKNWKEAYEMWERTFPRAQNDALFPTIDDMEKFANYWTSSVRDKSIINNLSR